MPGWQNAFVLGPNVRFTRTPESAFNRRMPVETPNLPEEELPVASLAPVDSEAVTQQQSVEPHGAPVSEVTVKPAEQRVPPPRMPFLPQPPDARGARALTYKLRLELARKQAEEAAAATMTPVPTDMYAAVATSAQPSRLSSRAILRGAGC